ncbi:MAG: hypothetical protein OES32_05700 [Acidobacteriota bacterium]|nr:hypothetical protein [Acidobacteriota bacterium]MDH3523061.1 hypothetical protein [Acidobacteriota bacterium]
MDTLSFTALWSWLQGHLGCIQRVSTPEAVLFDDDDLHWYLGPLDGNEVVQVIRGKRLMGEIVVDPERVSYVQALGEESAGEYVFEAISETETERVAVYTFVLVHDLDAEGAPAHGSGIH